jgi:hypothetical protein
MITPESPKKLEVAAVEVEPEAAYPEFDAPQGFEVPEGSEPGADFQAVATVRQKADGRLCLVSLDGAEFAAVAAAPVEEEVVEEEQTAGAGPEDGGYAAFQTELEDAQRKMKGR